MKDFSIFTIQRQYHLTQDFTDADEKDVKSQLKKICDYLSQNNIVCIYCKVFLQNTALLQDLVIELKQSGQDPIVIPLEYPSVTGSVMSGINIFGIHNDELEKFAHNTEYDMDFVCYSYKGFKYFHGMHLFQDNDTAFANCQLMLSRYDFKPTSLIRTWYYLNQIHKFYPEFNKSRNRFFDKNNIRYDKHSAHLPASTCIEGSYLGSHLMHLYAVDLSDRRATKTRIYNISQSEADGDQYLFQPAFSRGMLTDYCYSKELQISGTASVGADGKSQYVNDAYQQLKTSLCYVTDLLQDAGMLWEHLCECTMFFADASLYQQLDQACDEVNIKRPNGISVIGHVCRKDLLFEIDGIAKKACEKLK